MRTRTLLIGATLLVAATTAPATADRPLRQVRSDNERFELRLDPGRDGRPDVACEAALFEHASGRSAPQLRWERPLVNDAAPVRAFIRNDGRYVVTLDEFRRGGARHALVIYGQEGQLLRHFLLSDLLDKSDWRHVRVRERSIDWLEGAQCGYSKDGRQFVIRLRWERTLRIDLKMLHPVTDKRAEAAYAAVPAEILGVVLGHAQDGPGHDEGLAEAAPADDVESTTTGGMITAETEAADDPNAFELVADLDQPAAEDDDGLQEIMISEDAVVVMEDEAPAVADESNLSIQPPEREVASALTDVPLPMPDPYQPQDYLTWLNALGAVSGAEDAAPLYEAASERYVHWEGHTALLKAALRGDPDALESPLVLQWLDDNREALELYRAASLQSGRSYAYHSDDGSLVHVLLPTLSPLRNLTRVAVIEGHRARSDGDARSAAELYLDALAAGAHTGQGMTMIENLVGQAMQSIAADALLDLQALPVADQLDYFDLALATEEAYRPTRPIAETVQGERACLLDSVQRIWKPDPTTGALVVDTGRATEFLSLMQDAARAADYAEELRGFSFAGTVAQSNTYWDAMTEAVLMPYPRATERIADLESWLANEGSSNPILRSFMPSLDHYHYNSTRSEATRRAALLVTNLNAYYQEYGEYPPSLEAFSGFEFSIDPFRNDRFAYGLTDHGFKLYSFGANARDDAGYEADEERKGDLLFWPRRLTD